MSGEHGIGYKKLVDFKRDPPGEYKMIRAIKKALDPNDISIRQDCRSGRQHLMVSTSMYELDILKAKETGVRVGACLLFLRFCKNSPLTRGAEWDILNKLLSDVKASSSHSKYLKKELDKLLSLLRYTSRRDER